MPAISRWRSIDLPINPPPAAPTLPPMPTHTVYRSSTPSNSQTLYNNLATAGVNTASATTSGGFIIVPVVSGDECSATSPHGFLGTENTAIKSITNWLDIQAAALSANRRPEATFATVTTGAGVT